MKVRHLGRETSGNGSLRHGRERVAGVTGGRQHSIATTMPASISVTLPTA